MQHFKTYQHLWYLTTLKHKFPLMTIRRRFLPPGLSYNICDSHFAHFKTKVDNAAANYHGPSNLRDITWLLGEYAITLFLLIRLYGC
jgi:hypothetical protein